MDSFKSLVEKKLKLFESVPADLTTAAERVQIKAWRTITPLLNSMEVDTDGNIVQSESNVKKIGLIVDELNGVLGGKEYKDAVKSFLSSIDEGVNLTNEIAQKIDKNFEPTTAQKQLLQLSKTNAINSFIGAGVRERFTQPFLEQLTANVSARAPLREMIKSLEGVVIGTDTTDGRLLGNIKTTSITAQAVADRSYSAAVNEELGVEWFQYLGGEIDSTRPFCLHREAQYFHRKEIEKWGNGQNSAGINDIVDGTWAGRIAGTDSKSIFTFVGGWNCRHYLVPVSTRDVPDTDIERAKKEGYI